MSDLGFISANLMRFVKLTGSTSGNPKPDTWASAMSLWMICKLFFAASSSRKIVSKTSCNGLVVVSSSLTAKWPPQPLLNRER